MSDNDKQPTTEPARHLAGRRILARHFGCCVRNSDEHGHERESSGSQAKPNILVIWGDDIGIDNISAYNLGLMGYKTPNIDRIAKEGALFTDAYAPAELHGRSRRRSSPESIRFAPGC